MRRIYIIKDVFLFPRAFLFPSRFDQTKYELYSDQQLGGMAEWLTILGVGLSILRCDNQISNLPSIQFFMPKTLKAANLDPARLENEAKSLRLNLLCCLRYSHIDERKPNHS